MCLFLCDCPYDTLSGVSLNCEKTQIEVRIVNANVRIITVH